LERLSGADRVPGWSGTYWVKHITSITAVTKPFDGF
jgi:sulfite dehydrogenase